MTTDAYGWAAVGENVTPMVQLLPAATVDWAQLLLAAGSVNTLPPVFPMVVMLSGALPVLVTVSVLVLVPPTWTLPKSMSLTVTAGVAAVAVPASADTLV